MTLCRGRDLTARARKLLANVVYATDRSARSFSDAVIDVVVG